MLLKSVYLKDSTIAVVSFVRRVDGRMLIPLSLWRSSSKDFGFSSEVKKDFQTGQTTVVSPDLHGLSTESSSFLKTVLEKEQVAGVRISDPFEMAQGLAVLWQLQQYGSIDCEYFSGWAKMQAEIEQAERSPSAAVLAFFQGLIYYQLHCTTA